jgi:hypothetical protein
MGHRKTPFQVVWADTTGPLLFLRLEVYLRAQQASLKIYFLLFAQVQEIGKQVDYIGDKVVVFLRVCFKCRDCPVSPRFVIHESLPLEFDIAGTKTLFPEIEITAAQRKCGRAVCVTVASDQSLIPFILNGEPRVEV